MKKTIFVVDDSDTNLRIAKETLSGKYNVFTMPSAEKMFELLKKINPSLILLDINMPEMDGFTALKKLKAQKEYQQIPIIFLTAAYDDEDYESRGFELGVSDFIGKPFSAPVLLNRVKLQIDINELIDNRTKQLIERTIQLEERSEQLKKVNLGMLLVLSDVVENRDKGTGGHIERTAQYVKVLVAALMERGMYTEALLDCNLDLVETFALLHDVGKIGVSDTILNKPGKLTDEEFTLMQNHVLNGENIINQIIIRTGENNFLTNVKLFALYHHENWDGTGYPYGLKGEEIPIQGRIMAFADVYDALISRRPYKSPLTHKETVEIMMKDAGHRFDPNVANVFYEICDEFEAIAISVNEKL